MKLKNLKIFTSLLFLSLLLGCSTGHKKLSIEVFETAAHGNRLKKLSPVSLSGEVKTIHLLPNEQYQTITGFGGAFTESSASLLNQMSKKNRDTILHAYFGSEGARYSLTRTHMNSCDFSLGNYSYAPVAGDKTLENFSIDEDRDDLIPMIKDAMAHSEDGFKIIASPWTAPPWMKDNNAWKGGKLLPEYYGTWALFFSKYLEAYKNEGIEIWGLTVENEPLGNDSNWESMHFSPEEMIDFVVNHLDDSLKSGGHAVKVLAYDQNRGHELEVWAKAIYSDEKVASYFDGFAVHWYASTFDWFPQSLNFTHDLAPDKYLIQSEACIDAEVPHWKDDTWYWEKEATDWGWDWAPEAQKKYHPKYVPVYRYARDIIGCMNSWVDGWIDWNMVLDRQGGPNWAKNWCIAPVIVDPENDEVYFTPLYDVMVHFSRFIRPGAVRIGFENTDESLLVTAVQNPDGTVVVVILNSSRDTRQLKLTLADQSADVSITGQALQTIVIEPEPAN